MKSPYFSERTVVIFVDRRKSTSGFEGSKVSGL